jgi:hypothetical protein
MWQDSYGGIILVRADALVGAGAPDSSMTKMKYRKIYNSFTYIRKKAGEKYAT